MFDASTRAFDVAHPGSHRYPDAHTDSHTDADSGHRDGHRGRVELW